MNEVTRILNAVEQGDPHAADQLLPLVYDELRQLAAQRLAHETPGQTLQATALVHEAYLRLVASSADEPGKEPHWNSRGHFFAACAEAMRRILIEKARHKQRLRHGGGRRRLDLDQLDVADEGTAEDLLALDEALDRLAAEEPEVAEVVKLRYFAGLTIDQTASALGLSVRTANRHWAYARAWLFQQLGQSAEANE
jgi:RNA polymerase sigma factor (TIGR02999 family)